MVADVNATGRLPWCGAILAGGAARRLGGLRKSHLRIGGRTVLDRQLAAFEAVGVPVVLVVDRADRLDDAPCPVLVDGWPGAGPLGGLATALTSGRADRWLVVACDLPFIAPAFLALLIDRLGEHDAVVPRDDDRWHPLAAAYAAPSGDVFRTAVERGERAIWRTLSALDVVALERFALDAVDPGRRLLVNLNTPADIEALDE